MKTTKTNPKSICKNCLSVLDAATSFKNNTPSKGDISICFNCKAVSRFNENLDLTPITDVEMIQIKEEAPMVYEQILQAKQLLNFIKK